MPTFAAAPRALMMPGVAEEQCNGRVTMLSVSKSSFFKIVLGNLSDVNVQISVLLNHTLFMKIIKFITRGAQAFMQLGIFA
jgi:hypothetical protein